MTDTERIQKASSLIGNELRLAYSLSMAVDTLMNDIALRIRHLGGFKRERKMNFATFCDCVRKAMVWWEKCEFEKEFITMSEGDMNRLDGFRQDANEIIRFVMLYIDRTGSEETRDAIEKILTEADSFNIFNESDLARFSYRTKEGRR